MTITKDICSVCEEVHDVELLKVGGDHGVLYKVWKCVSTNETWESIQTPKNLEEWAEMYLHCENKACGNLWCEDCTRVWDELMHGKRAVEHHAHADGATVCAKCGYQANYPVCTNCGNAIPAPPLTQTVRRTRRNIIMKYGMADELLPATSEGGRAVEAFIKICPPVDRANLDLEWMEMCGLFVKGWLAKAAEHNAHLTPESLASSQAVVNASSLEQSDSVPPPAQAQVA